MKYKKLLARLVLACLLPLNLAVAEFRVPFTNKTIDEEISRLSIKYRVDSDTARAVIQCESQMNGSAINENKDENGITWSKDIGLFQINNYFHEKTMNDMGLNINNQWDNLEYGFILISKQGLSAWKASKSCWLKKLA